MDQNKYKAQIEKKIFVLKNCSAISGFVLFKFNAKSFFQRCQIEYVRTLLYKIIIQLLCLTVSSSLPLLFLFCFKIYSIIDVYYYLL